jgi:RecA-family ATPase
MKKIQHYLRGNKTKQWLIKNLIPTREIVILYAQTNMYKTFLSLKIAFEVATGSQELGATKIGKVHFFSPDTTQEDLIPRSRALVIEKYPKELHDHIYANLSLNFDNDLDLTSDGWGFKVIQTGGGYEDNYKVTKHKVVKPWDEWDYIYRDIYDDTESERWDDLKNEEEPYCGLIIIDTFSQAIGSSSINDDGAIRNAIKNLKKIIHAENYNVSILVIAHAGKDKSKGIMGSSLQKNDFPTVLKIRKRQNGQMELYREKMKSKAQGTSIPFKMRETVVDKEEMLYVDIGSSVTKLESDIIDLHKDGLDKDNIRDNTYKTHGQQYNNKKSFNVIFARKWKSLLKQGFLDSEQQDNS